MVLAVITYSLNGALYDEDIPVGEDACDNFITGNVSFLP